MKHAADDAFNLYRVPERLGDARLCENRDDMGRWPEYKPRDKPRYGKYYAATFYLRAGDYKGAALYLLWAKDGGQWKIVSYHAEPTEAAPTDIPDLRDDTAFEIAQVDGPIDLVAATLDFHKSWFVTHEYDRVLAYLTDESDRCLDVYLPNGEEPPADPSAYDRRLEIGFERTVTRLGLRDGTPLEQAIRAIEPADPVVRVVKHPASDYYTILALPDFVAENATCARRLQDAKFPTMPDEPSYGTYYAGAFRANIPGEPALLYTLWAQRDDRWRVIAWHIEQP